MADGLAGTRLHVVVLADAPEPLVGLLPSELDFADVRHPVGARGPGAGAGARARRRRRGSGSASWSGSTRRRSRCPPTATPTAQRLDVGTLRLLAESTAALLDHDELTELVEHWAKTAADGGYDVRGDLAALTPAPPVPDVPLSALRAALAETLAEVGRLRGRRGQCGCQASSSAVLEVTALGSLPSASCWMETCSNTSRSERRAAIQTCWRTSAVSLYSTASGRRP